MFTQMQPSALGFCELDLRVICTGCILLLFNVFQKFYNKLQLNLMTSHEPKCRRRLLKPKEYDNHPVLCAEYENKKPHLSQIPSISELLRCLWKYSTDERCKDNMGVATPRPQNERPEKKRFAATFRGALEP